VRSYACSYANTDPRLTLSHFTHPTAFPAHSRISEQSLHKKGAADRQAIFSPFLPELMVTENNRKRKPGTARQPSKLGRPAYDFLAVSPR